MKNFLKPLLLTATVLVSSPHLSTASPSEYVDVERFNTNAYGVLTQEHGYLLNNGRYKPLALPEPLWWWDISDTPSMIPFLGKPVMSYYAYDLYKRAGMINHWVCSAAAFDVGGFAYVGVGVRGKSDPNPAVRILEQPHSLRVLEGQWCHLFVDAEPWIYISYQWYKGSRKLTDQRDAFLWFQPIQKTNAGIYKVAMSTGGRASFSKPARIVIVKPVAVKQPPRSRSVPTGATVTFRVSVTGTPPYQYQWYKDGVKLEGSTKSVLFLRKVSVDSAGVYWVEVNNGPSEDWAQAELTVTP